MTNRAMIVTLINLYAVLIVSIAMVLKFFQQVSMNSFFRDDNKFLFT